jgi:hypothetical protein
MTARSYSRSLGSVGRNEVENLVSLFFGGSHAHKAVDPCVS